MSIFETLSQINVNKHTEKKGKFTYLSWAWAWGELLKRYPESKRIVYEDDDGLPFFGSANGIMVKVGIVVGGIERIEYLPVMNHQNRCIKYEDATMMDINKAIQRCSVKAIARHGLGLYIYAGEDLPEEILPELIPGTETFNKAKLWIKNGNGTIERARQKYVITKECEKLLIE